MRQQKLNVSSHNPIIHSLSQVTILTFQERNEDFPITSNHHFPGVPFPGVPGQIISLPHATKNSKRFWKGNRDPLLSGKSRLVKYYNLVRCFVL